MHNILSNNKHVKNIRHVIFVNTKYNNYILKPNLPFSILTMGDRLATLIYVVDKGLPHDIYANVNNRCMKKYLVLYF